MADLKARIGPRHDSQTPFANKVWANPALANSKQSPISRARTSYHPDASPKTHTPSPNPEPLSLLDRLNISPGTNGVNKNDPVKHAEEGRAKSLLERVQPKKLSGTPLPSPSPKQSGTNGDHLTPNSPIAENSSSDGRAFTKNKQDVTTSNSNVSNDVHEDACSHASSSQPYKSGIDTNAQHILESSPDTTPSTRRNHTSIAPSASGTPQANLRASPNSLVKHPSLAVPGQSKIPSQTARSTSLREPSLDRTQTQLPSGANESYHKDSLAQIRDKFLPLIQKNAAARTSSSHIGSGSIHHTEISDDNILTFIRRSSEVNKELQARGISTLPPKPAQMSPTFPATRCVDPIRRISKDFTNDKPSTFRSVHSHSRHGSAEDRRMNTRSSPSMSFHARHESTESSRRPLRSPPPPHWRGSTSERHRQSRSPSTFRQRNLSDDPHRFDRSPQRHSRQISTSNPPRRHSKSPFRNPGRSASPRRRSSFTSRLDREGYSDRYSHHRNNGPPIDMKNSVLEGHQYNDTRPRSLSRGVSSSGARGDSASLTHSHSDQSFHHDRRASLRSGHESPRRNWERRSDSPNMRRRSASPRRQHHPDPSIIDTTGRSSHGNPSNSSQEPMRTTPTVLPPDQLETHRSTESPNSRADHQADLGENARHSNTPNDIPPGDPLPCHNVPGIWFAEYGQPTMSTKLCAFQIDGYTAQRWGIRGSDIETQEYDKTNKLSLRLCCVPKKQFEECVESVVGLPDSSPRQIASAIFALEKKWPVQGKLIITLNPDTPHKRVWLPHQIGTDYVPIEDFVREGQNIVQLVQLSDLSDFVFVLYATNIPGPTEHIPRL